MMNLGLRATQTFALFAIPAVTGAIAALPSQAATFSFANTEVIFFDFNVPEATNLVTSTDTNTSTVSFAGQVTAEAEAEAGFVGIPPLAGNFATSLVSGSGPDYFGTARSEATVQGQFAVESVFSFDFEAVLELYTSVDDPSTESASASADIIFQLFDSTDPNNLMLLDTFSVSGFLNSADSNDFLTSYISPYIDPVRGRPMTFWGGNQEGARARFLGSYQRTFAQPLLITLVESKNTHTNASAVPEPFTVFGTIIGLAGGIVLKRRKAIASEK